MDGDESKLIEALSSPITNIDRGIVVEEFNYMDMNISNARGCSNKYVWHDCYYGTHERIYGRYEIYSDIINNTGLPTHSLFFYPYKGTLLAYVRSEFKGFLGLWYLAQTNITWSIGWGVSSTNSNI